MSWFTDTDNLFETVPNEVLDNGLAESLLTEVCTSYKKKKIGLAETSWRLFVLSKQVLFRSIGLSYSATLHRLQVENNSPANMIPVRKLEQYLLDRLAFITPGGAVVQDTDTGKVMNMTATAYNTFVMHAWAYGKAVYVIDADVAASVCTAETLNIPCAVLRHLPTPAFCIQHTVGDVVAAFFNVAIDEAGGVVLGYSLVRNIPNDIKTPIGSEVNFVIGEPEGCIELSSELVDGGDVSTSPIGVYLNLLFLLCCKNIDIVGTVTQTPGPSVDSKTRKILMTPGERKWNVGFRQGAALRASAAQARDTSEGCDTQTGRTVRAHLRRAHWHHFWTGPRDAERTLVLHWVAPILVGAADDIVETRHRVAGVDRERRDVFNVASFSEAPQAASAPRS
jgi:hypothetical protein